MSASPHKTPVRAIYNETDLAAFHKSKTYADFLAFVRLCNERVRGIPVSEEYTHKDGPAVGALVAYLEEAWGWVDDIPPLQQPMRFGNKAFRDWHSRLMATAAAAVEGLLVASEKFVAGTSETAAAAAELLPYLTSAFGHPVRIDYGTGHESSFFVFLYGLFRFQVLALDDLTAAVLQGFRSYLRTLRRLQAVYMLEPAGSHGVWGLDDYFCLVFYLGSSQLVDHPTLTPSAIHSDATLQAQKDDYLYLAQVSFIKELKARAPFAESSPMLNDISALPSWSKVNTGMLRLYEGEVLGKLPVIQHFLFGDFFPATWIPSPPTDGPLPNTSHTGLETTKAPWYGETQKAQASRPMPMSPLQKELLEKAKTEEEREEEEEEEEKGGGEGRGEGGK